MRPDGPSRPPRDPKVAALELVALAHRVSTGELRLPREGQGPLQIEGRIVVPDPVHALVCGWRSSTLWEVPGEPAVRECHGCGLLRLLEEERRAPDPSEAEPLASVTTMRRTAR